MASQRWKFLVAAGALSMTSLLLVAHDLGKRSRSRHTNAQTLRVMTLGVADLCLSTTSRWLRHPTQVESGAAFDDAPSSLDADAAGAWISPPRALFGDATIARSGP